MEKHFDIKQALARCQRATSKSETCSHDIREKLKIAGANELQMDEIVEKLRADKFIDDQRYAIAFVKDKVRFNHSGRVKITAMLRQKQIDQQFINEAFNQLDEKIYLEVLHVEARKKAQTLSRVQPFERNRKVANYLLSKGFEPEKVFAHLKMND